MASTRRRGAHAAAAPDTTSAGAAPVAAASASGTGSAGAAGAARSAGVPAAAGATAAARPAAARAGGFRARLSPLRVVIAVLVLGFATVVVTGGLWSSPSAEPTVQQFLLDWQQRSYAAAAALTTGNVAEVTNELANAYSKLGAAAFYLNMGPIRQSGGIASARFTASVDLGQDGAPWMYTGNISLRRIGPGWKIVWSPTVINPGLGPGLQLAVISSTHRRQPILDAGGQPLQVWSTAEVVGVKPGSRLKDPQATAASLGQITGIEPSEILTWIRAAPRNRFQELVTYRPSDYRKVARQITKVPGLKVRKERVRLFDSTAPAVVGSVDAEASEALRNAGIAYRPGATVGLSGLQRRYQNFLTGTPTTQVVAETANGRRVRTLKTWPGRRPAAVHTTIESGVQQAASQAVAAAPGSAAIVALQASSGRILAVAGHKASRMPGIDPLYGHYAPGAAFTIVSSEALLAKGVNVNTPIPCTPGNSVGGHNFSNVPRVSTDMSATFAADFAKSCANAIAGLSQQLSTAELNKAASGFGFGRQWQLPVRSFSGSVGSASGVAGLAAATIGQGNVKVSPLAMANVAAQVATGTWHEPSLVTTPPDARASGQAPFAASTLTTLRAMMRAAVRSGAARRADVAGHPVFGQVGTTLLVSGKHRKWATWFVGYRGGIAFAVLVVSGSSRVSAAPVAANFLRAAPIR
jgi:cell division protein FtsI/penicillin-binding protein 2